MNRLQKMKELAIEEAKNLKKHMTLSEVNSLDKSIFDPNDTHQCIYGMATGSCRSERALELIKKCAKRVYNTKKVVRREEGRLNGSPSPVDAFCRIDHYLSPIETLIFPKNGGENSGLKIIDYLKGETKKLVL